MTLRSKELNTTQLTFTCTKSTIETLEKYVEYVLSCSILPLSGTLDKWDFY